MSDRAGPSVLTFGPAASVVLAVALAHALDMRDTWWAAISAFVVMQESLVASLYRGLHRVIGSALGAALGFVLGPLFGGYPFMLVPLMGLLTWGGLFAALTSRYDYAWVLALITFVMVMCEAVGPAHDLGLFAFERMANVMVGTAACILVAILIELVLRSRHRPAPAAPVQMPGHAPDVPVDRRDALIHALPGGISVAMLAAAVGAFELGALTQGMVTTVAVMIVPLDRRGGEPRVLITDRMLQRVIGCLLAGAIAFALLPVFENSPLLCQAALCAGVLAGTVVEMRYPRLRYGAMQFTIAFIMVFVQDRGWTIEEGAAMERLVGILVGTMVLYVVYTLVQRMFRRP